jgi:hypothetical protein
MDLPNVERARHRTEARRWYHQAIKQMQGLSLPKDLFGGAVLPFRKEADELLGENNPKK